MKRNIVKLLIAAMVIGGLGFNSAFAEGTAYVDVQKVVSASTEVKKLKEEQLAKGKEFMTALEKARKDVASVTDVKKKQALEEKYNKEFEAKKAKMDEEYSNKLLAIEASISNIIAEKAKNKGYDMVVAKNIVLYGGEDMTEEIVKAVSQPPAKPVQKSKSKYKKRR